MAEGMEVEPAPAVRDKKRFEVKKVSMNHWTIFVPSHCFLSLSLSFSFSFSFSLPSSSSLPTPCIPPTTLSFHSQWNAVALWSWGKFFLTQLHKLLFDKTLINVSDIVVDNCAICRNHIMDLCKLQIYKIIVIVTVHITGLIVALLSLIAIISLLTYNIISVLAYPPNSSFS